MYVAVYYYRAFVVVFSDTKQGVLKMKIYLTGSTGSLGSGVMKYFGTHKIIAGKANILSKEQLLADIIKSDCDAIMHTAAIVGSSSCDAFGKYSQQVNVEGTKNIVEIADKLDIKLIHFSSTAIYGKYSHEKTIEEDTSSTPNTLYARTKYDSEYEVEDLALEQQMIIRPTMIYHTNDALTNQKSLNYAIKSTLNNEPQIVLNLDPNTYKCYTHIEDFCNILEALITKNCWGEDFNISCGADKCKKVESIFNYIVDELENITPNKTNIIFRRDKDTLGHHIVSCKKAINYSGVIPKYTIKEGIDEMIAHYKKLEKKK